MVASSDPMDYDHPPGHGFIRTYPSRSWLNLRDPDVTDIHLCDIAHALSLVNRFAGHMPRGYSVAEHSMYVSSQLMRLYGDRQLALQGLLHDATEAYLGDVTRPLKTLLPEYKTIELRMEEVIAERFHLPYELDARVKQVDTDVLAWEMAMFRDCDLVDGIAPQKMASAFVVRAGRLGLVAK